MQNNGNNNSLQDVENNLKVAHQKLTQAQQKVDNREVNEQLVLEQALDAVVKAQDAISRMK